MSSDHSFTIDQNEIKRFLQKKGTRPPCWIPIIGYRNMQLMNAILLMLFFNPFQLAETFRCKRSKRYQHKTVVPEVQFLNNAIGSMIWNRDCCTAGLNFRHDVREQGRYGKFIFSEHFQKNENTYRQQQCDEQV